MAVALLGGREAGTDVKRTGEFGDKSATPSPF